MTNAHKYKVALVQMRMGPDPEANFAAALGHIREAAGLGANIVCLPELFRAQYFCQREELALFDLSEKIPGPSTARLGEVARESGVAIIASLFEHRAPGLYHNTAVTLNAQGAIASVYRKMHIPDDPLYYEKYYFAPGDLGFKSVDMGFGCVGTLVCWDQWYPEGARLTALQGAEVLFYPTAIGWHPAEKEEFGAAQYDAWQTIQRSHAIANGVYVAGVNRVGHEHGDVMGNRAAGPGIEFWGGSFLADPFGRVIAKASHDAEEILLGEIDTALIEETRRNWPFLRDRRIDAYAPISRRFLDRETESMEDECLIPNGRFELDHKPDSAAPGIYFIFLKDGASLGDFPNEKDCPLYIGKAESSIEARNHANYETSSKSSLRRSLGAILRTAIFPDFSVFPRKTRGKGTARAIQKAIQNYCFVDDSEQELSRWMLANLSFCYRNVRSDTREIRELERCYIKHWNPVLNLTYSKNSHRDRLELLREQCRAEARKRARESE